MWFVCWCNSFFSLCRIQDSIQTYLSLTHHCDAARALLGEQYRAAFLTSLSNRSYRHTMTALITSLHSHHLGIPQWCPFRTAVRSLRYPFKQNTKLAVSVPDLLTPNLVLCASNSSLTVRQRVRPLCPSVPYHGRISVVPMWQESVLPRGAISSATYWTNSGDKHKTCRSDGEVGVWWWFGVWTSILKPVSLYFSRLHNEFKWGDSRLRFDQIKFRLAVLVSCKRGLAISPLVCKFYAVLRERNKIQRA